MSSSASQQRSELITELLRFDTVHQARTSQQDWHLPPYWEWDARGGPKGQLHSSPSDFTGEEWPDHTPKRSTKLGEGIAGKVYRVRCNGKILARKKVHIDINRARRTVANAREIQALKQLDHHHVSQLVGLYILDNDLYSLSYPVAEMTLLKFLASGRPTDPSWCNTLLEGLGCLSNAVAYMHSVGVKHRDIHNENVLMLGGTMILCDFGGSQGSNNRPITLPVPEPFQPRAPTESRAWDVMRLGQLFAQMLRGVYGSADAWDDRYYQAPQTELDKENLRRFSAAPKRIDREQLRGLFQLMTAKDERERPSAALVAQYLRRGYFEWGGGGHRGEIDCNTCGQCCRG